MIKNAGYQGAKEPVSPKGPKVDPSQQTSPFARKDNHAPVAPAVKSVPSTPIAGKAPKMKGL